MNPCEECKARGVFEEPGLPDCLSSAEPRAMWAKDSRGLLMCCTVVGYFGFCFSGIFFSLALVSKVHVSFPKQHPSFLELAHYSGNAVGWWSGHLALLLINVH